MRPCPCVCPLRYVFGAPLLPLSHRARADARPRLLDRPGQLATTERSYVRETATTHVRESEHHTSTTRSAHRACDRIFQDGSPRRPAQGHTQPVAVLKMRLGGSCEEEAAKLVRLGRRGHILSVRGARSSQRLLGSKNHPLLLALRRERNNTQSDPFFRADTLLIPHDYRYEVPRYEGPQTRTGAYTQGTQFMRHGI